ncbi:MAG: ATP-dependent RecD-like DNA helicase [Chlamydiota bacterium]
MDQITGLVDSIVFVSEETGFTVARLKSCSRELISIVGTMPGVAPGETIQCYGLWKHHAKHGRQFEVDRYELSAPADLYGIRKYLESGLVKGIGPTYAQRIVDQFGLDTLHVIDKEPHRLEEVEGIGKKRFQSILACWEEQKAIREVMIFLQSHQVTPAFARKIYKMYGNQSIEKVKQNPYALARDVFGIGFKIADNIALNLGIGRSAPKRIQAAIEHLLWELSSEGHVCYAIEQLIPQVGEQLGIEAELVNDQIETLKKEKNLVSLEIPFGGQKRTCVWVRPLYYCEVGIAEELKRLYLANCHLRDVALDKAVDWVEQKLRIQFAPEQKRAIELSLCEKIHLITGGPGTGKSTITKAILTITVHLSSRIILAAPTGRAAKRLAEITRKKAFTIHSLLEFDFMTGKFKRNRENPLKADLLVIDEASMIDTQLMYHLLKAIPDTTRVIFIGDVDQLPSVGPGNVLKDCLASKVLPVTRLKHIFRQGKGSQIVVNAHRINEGKFPFIQSRFKSDFLFFELDQPEAIAEKIIALITTELPNQFPFRPIQDIQVLAPMKRGVIGIDNLNHLLQKKLNSETLYFSRMGRTFYLSDKVMQIRNNYDKKVYNGDVGWIQTIDLERETLSVSFDGYQVEYAFSESDELVLAYAVSVHKYQGSECPCVIFPVHTCHFKLLFRNLLYTGITRGKKLVILLGTKRALAMAINRDDVKQRFTGLAFHLQQTFAALTAPELCENRERG